MGSPNQVRSPILPIFHSLDVDEDDALIIEQERESGTYFKVQALVPDPKGKKEIIVNRVLLINQWGIKIFDKEMNVLM